MTSCVHLKQIKLTTTEGWIITPRSLVCPLLYLSLSLSLFLSLSLSIALSLSHAILLTYLAVSGMIRHYVICLFHVKTSHSSVSE